MFGLSQPWRAGVRPAAAWTPTRPGPRIIPERCCQNLIPRRPAQGWTSSHFPCSLILPIRIAKLGSCTQTESQCGQNHGEPSMVKTTLLMPEDLWRRAKIRALEENRDLRDLLLEGLELVLKRGRGGK